MAVWENASARANRTELGLRRRGMAAPEASTDDLETTNRWHPRRTLAFIVLSCLLLWGGILALAGIL
jgi:hypothetical protein